VKKSSYLLMKKAIAASVVVLTMTPLFAQKPPGERQAETLQLEQYRRTKDVDDRAQDERRRQAEWMQSDMVRKANKFALLWAQFTAQANTRHTFDIKLAKQLEKAFSDLQKAEGWPGK
jgi:hypothetical protein